MLDTNTNPTILDTHDAPTLPEEIRAADVLAQTVEAAVKAAPVQVLARIQEVLDAHSSYGGAESFAALVLACTGRGAYRADVWSLGLRYKVRDAAALFLAARTSGPLDDAAAGLCAAVGFLVRVDQHPTRNEAMIPMAHEVLSRARLVFAALSV